MGTPIEFSEPEEYVAAVGAAAAASAWPIGKMYPEGYIGAVGPVWTDGIMPPEANIVLLLRRTMMSSEEEEGASAGAGAGAGAGTAAATEGGLTGGVGSCWG